MGRMLGLDIGTKRIGIALSDPTQTIASPHQVLESVGREGDVLAIAKLGESEEVEGYVVGLPLRLDGLRGGMAAQVEELAQRLADVTQKPVHLFDERWTTAIAERSLREGSLSRQARKERRDAVAAAIILQSWLDQSKPREQDV